MRTNDVAKADAGKEEHKRKQANNNASENNKANEVDSLIREHIEKRSESSDSGLPVAAVSTSDRFSWAKQADVGLEFVDERLEAVCQELKTTDERLAVPRFRMKSQQVPSDA